jgi:molybdopterin molybdotransferase
MSTDLVPVEAHLADVLAAVRPMIPVRLGLEEAEGGVLTEDAAALCPLPPFDNSAMDGYAVRASDVAAAADAPVVLPVAGQVPAGDTRTLTLTPGTSARIMTGALLPAGADAVVPVERTDGGIDQVAIRAPAAPGDSIRRRGDDARQGDELLAAGTRIGPPQLGLLAAAGRGSVLARPRPRLTVISTGNELAEPGTPLVPGQIWESNSFMLAAAARQAGCVARRHPIVPDRQDAVLAAIEDALAHSDLLVTSGGVSMGGEHDVVKATLQKLGTVSFRKVAMQPGMPQGFGLVGPSATPILTLPGNPVSAYVSFRLFVVPAVQALQDLYPKRPVSARAVLTADLRSPPDKRSFLRAVLDPATGSVTPVTGQASHQLAALARANALIVVPEQVTAMAAGQTVDVLELPW